MFYSSAYSRTEHVPLQYCNPLSCSNVVFAERFSEILDGWVKANSEGLSKGNLGDPACGEIFRDHLGEHLGGFRLFLGHGTTF